MKPLIPISCVLLIFLLQSPLGAQGVAIRTDGMEAHPSAILDLQSDDQGILIPRMTTAQRMAIVDPADGLIVFDTQTRSIWIHQNMIWSNMAAHNRIVDADGDTQVRVEKLPDEDAIRMDLAGQEVLVIRENANGSISLELPHASQNTIIGHEAGLQNNPVLGVSGDGMTAVGYQAGYANTSGQYNTLFGNQAGRSNTSGDRNTGLGFQSLYTNSVGVDNTATGHQSLYSNTNGDGNTGIGQRALYSNTLGNRNTALGYFSLQGNISGSENTAVGTEALNNNIDGVRNSATGYRALYFNADGFQNTATGSFALYSNIGGNQNTAMGFEALYSNTTGNNTALGYRALRNNTTGIPNVAVGFEALRFNTTGDQNIGIGYRALYTNTTGDLNLALGNDALYLNTTGIGNTAIGYRALYNNTDQGGNTALGRSAGGEQTFTLSTMIGYYAYPNASGYSNANAIGYNARSTASNQFRFGNSNVSSIGGYEDWTNLSDGRFKQSIQENVAGLDFIRDLRPVTYQLDMEGLAEALGEDVEMDETGKLIPKAPDAETLEARQAKGAVRYSGFIAQEVEAAAAARGYSFSGVDAPDNPDDFYGLRYGTFVVPLVKAVQELAALADHQEARLATLEMENEALKNQQREIQGLVQELHTRLAEMDTKLAEQMQIAEER